MSELREVTRGTIRESRWGWRFIAYTQPGSRGREMGVESVEQFIVTDDVQRARDLFDQTLWDFFGCVPDDESPVQWCDIDHWQEIDA